MKGSGQTLLEVAQAASDEPLASEEEGRQFHCRRCNDTFSVSYELDPCPLCNACAHTSAYELGVALVRIYDHLKTLPVIVAAPIKLAIEHPVDDLGKAFVDEVLDMTARAVVRRRTRGRHKK